MLKIFRFDEFKMNLKIILNSKFTPYSTFFLNSIRKVTFLSFAFPLALLVSCAEKKSAPLPEVAVSPVESKNGEQKKSGAATFGPTNSVQDFPSNVVADESLNLNFENPKLTGSETLSKNAHADNVKIPEGLTLVGTLNRGRNTVIYIHGWTASGEAENFVAAEDWNRKGFNTFIFRWHRDSFEDAKMPLNAESRIYYSALNKLLSDYQKLSAILGPQYAQEIRIVGHSLGTQLATSFVYTLMQKSISPAPSRLDILDPFVGPYTRLPVQIQDQLGGTLIGDSMFNMITKMKNNKYVVGSIYASVTARTFAKILYGVMPTQVFATTWLGKLSADQHMKVLDAYFKSISEIKRPQSSDGPAYSAVYSASQLKNDSNKILCQMTGIDTVTLADDTYAPSREVPLFGKLGTFCI